MSLLKWLALAVACTAGCAARGEGADGQKRRALHELNKPAAPPAGSVIAITGAMLVDGTNRPAVDDAVVVIRGDTIAAVGKREAVEIPKEAQVVDGAGMTLLPGLIDAHFHLDGRNDRPGVFLRHGVTCVRDPGAWIEAYDEVRKSGEMIPRLFLFGPHLDCAPVAYPKDAFIVTNAQDVRDAVNRFVDQGGIAVKIYFRVPLDLIRVACQTAHVRGVPVTAHLERVKAVDAIEAGLDGIEHVTSFGTSLATPDVAEKFVEAVSAKNAARDPGRYALWGTLDLDHCPRLKPILDLAVRHGTVLCPTLAVFELRAGDKKATDAGVRGYVNMLKFTGMYFHAGGKIVVGSHSEVLHAEYGWAYPRELELLVEAGLTPAEVLRAATLEGAKYFRADDRLGSIEAGKRADLVLVDGNPLNDISMMRRVKRVMLNGQWVDMTPPVRRKADPNRELLKTAPK